MRISYDPEVDALSIVFIDTTVTTDELAEGIVVEYDAAGRIAGLEILDATARFGGIQALEQVLIERVGPTLVNRPAAASS